MSTGADGLFLELSLTRDGVTDVSVTWSVTVDAVHEVNKARMLTAETEMRRQEQ